MENGGGTMWTLLAVELVMCSTCSGFVLRKQRTAIPKPDEEVVEVVTEAEKMWDLMKAVLLHGPLQEMEPAEATKKQWQVLRRRRRRIMMETKRCPACSGPLLEACPTSSREDGSEFMAVLRSQGGKGWKKIATEDEAMVADARLEEQKVERSREEGKRSSSGLKEKKKAKSEDKEGSGSKKKKAKRSNEMEGSGWKEAKMEGSGSKDEMEGSEWKEAKMEGSGSKDEVIEAIVELVGGDMKTKMEVRRLLKKAFEILNDPELPVKPRSEEEAKMEGRSAGGNRKTKMVTKMLDKKSIDFLKNQPSPMPINYNKYYTNKRMVDIITAMDEVDRVFHEYLQCHSFVKGYAEYQLEVTDDEGDDHKLV